MSEFLNSIKITDEDKKNAIVKILNTIINSSEIMSLNELLRKQGDLKIDYGNKPVEQVLNENEILAAYTLANEIKISIMSGSNKQLIDYLELNLASVNEKNLLKFINEMIKDIELTKKITPNIKWYFQPGKIFKRLQGEEPCYEEESPPNTKEKGAKTIDINRYL